MTWSNQQLAMSSSSTAKLAATVFVSRCLVLLPADSSHILTLTQTPFCVIHNTTMRTDVVSKRRWQRPATRTSWTSSVLVVLCCLKMKILPNVSNAFVVLPSLRVTNNKNNNCNTPQLSVWSFGGTETMETIDTDADSCELVPVRIERTSANSRRILGEITAPVPVEDVWAILTDYDRLSIHVPNLMESRITEQLNNNKNYDSQQGDGQFRCRLFQRGAQKVFGFEFGASVTMDMQEVFISEPASAGNGSLGERMISFKCYDSFFFSGFDGEWKVKERRSEDNSGQVETVLSYVVDVRPKGPVPVAALEWRIKEDVPTNLRSVRRASIKVGREGVLASRKTPGARALNPSSDQKRLKDVKEKVTWYKDETMAAYLQDP